MSALNRKKVLGKALDFDGTNEHVILANVANLNFERSDPFSISLWLKFDDEVGATIIGKQDNEVPVRGYQIYYSWAATQFECVLQNTNAPANRIGINFNKALSTDTWYHVVMTYDGSSDESGLKLYVDGSEITGGDRVVESNTLTATMIVDHEFQFPGRQGANHILNGVLDEIAVFSEEVSAANVSVLYAGGIGLYINKNNWPNLVGLWHLDEGAGASAADSSDSGFTGTLQNMEEGDWVSGKIFLPAKRKIKHHTPQLLRK